jgi:glycosyltransferase involved in cell wall biosynthesis
VVVIATTIGYDGVPHAGGTYMKALCDFLAPLVDLTVVVPGTRVNREAAARPGAPQRVVPLGLEPSTSLPGKVANRLSLNLDTRWRRRDPGLPYLPLLVGLARSAEVRRAVREADVIDLQWSDSIRLVHLLRRLNPRARIVGTFHDVMSQSFEREPQETPAERRYWQGVARRSRRHEARMVAALDEVVVFSDKDVDLLGGPSRTRVVRPPLARGPLPQHQPAQPGAGTVVVVSYLARDENDKAARWAVEHLWPRVASRVPGARLRLVGGGASEELRQAVAGAGSVELAGFVDDLAAEYADAAVALVPVLQGAGVKFKTIEARLHGVPGVTTTVGAEGVGGADLFAALVDDPDQVAQALVDLLDDPASAQPRADRSQAWAAEEFSRERFVAQVLASWGLSG